ncbi:hypothetical protein PVAND_016027 [Polypedilum vanderplanki]|uniref:Gamma-interferon inducible lysosomal thiol reductase n=1 Tax=Polypedilum vanderplanki TaxID=319348 RepID=A0A9J6BEN7_POLVA|nr:hypothetical protein PVAND_016027 [Polypedilum vanderplanki]
MTLKLITILLAFSGFSQAAKPLKIDVYLESLCPASKAFMQEQLKPNYDEIKNDVLLKFIPFGKSQSTTNSSGTFFDCQHGRYECETNMFQACSLNLIGDDQERQTQFMICTMETQPERFPCAEKAGLKIDDVKKCTEGEEGIKLQLENEKLTKPIINQSGHVPSIVFNGIWTEEDDDAAQENFLKIVQDKLKEDFVIKEWLLYRIYKFMGIIKMFKFLYF